jgi:hypothetical protein
MSWSIGRNPDLDHNLELDHMIMTDNFSLLTLNF